jgi:hypothetical protein
VRGISNCLPLGAHIVLRTVLTSGTDATIGLARPLLASAVDGHVWQEGEGVAGNCTTSCRLWSAASQSYSFGNNAVAGCNCSCLSL